jgi:NAD(P)-dependent dehydrogenase (short-subunit alcohol dehydrogenase family)
MANYFIVGGSSGIGRQLSVQLTKTGHHVDATYFKNEMESDSTGISYHFCNVLEDNLNPDYLPQTLDGLVYCPGSINLRPFHRFDPSDFTKDYELQVIGAVKVIQKVLSRLKAAENASVVLFSTVAVQIGFPFHSQVASSKGAIEGLAKSLAAEFAPHIRVNCIAPSLTDTPLASHLIGNDEKRKNNAQRHPLKKIGDVADLANMVEFLLSGKSKWITGQIVRVDGGISTLKA